MHRSQLVRQAAGRGRFLTTEGKASCSPVSAPAPSEHPWPPGGPRSPLQSSALQTAQTQEDRPFDGA